MTLTDFLIELASDPDLAAQFMDNPQQVMADAALSQADQDLLLSGDPQAIRNAVDEEQIGDQIVIIMFVSVMVYGED